MTAPRKKNLIKLGITALFAGLFAALYALSQDIGQQTLADRYRILCDAFTLPGMLLVLFALLLTVSGEGALDGIAYGLERAVKMFTFRGTEQEKYADFVARRREKRPKGFGFLFVAGGSFLAVAALFLLLFYSAR